MNPARTGYVYGLTAYLMWGLFPLYWRLLRPAGAFEILSHRVVWSLVVVIAIITTVRGWRRVGALLRQPRKVGLVALAAVLISANWGTYIYGVNSDRVVETSLGYFMNPLVTVLLGVFVLGERMRAVQWVAMGIGGAAVAVLTVAYGHVPYIALTLATSFGLYGLIKKRLAVPAADGLLLESGALAVPALAFLIALGFRGGTTFGPDQPGHVALLILGGAVTAVPLLLFAGAANRIPLSAIGLLQYVAPILQLSIGVFILGEPMPPVRLAGFALVWLALAVFTWDGVRHRHNRTAVPSAPPVPVRV